MKRLEEYSPAGLASIGRDAFWQAVADACPDITTGDMAPGEDLAFERESEAVVETWLRNNVRDTQRWTVVVEAPRRITGVESPTVTVQAIANDYSEMLHVVEVHQDDMLERGT